jgi:hypothetical protein
MSGTSSRRPRVAVSRNGLPGEGVERLSARCDVTAWAGTAPPTPAELAGLVRGCEGLLVLGADRVDAALLDAAGPGLRVVALASMGCDGVDVAAAAARGVVVTHTPEVLADTTADVAMALILLARRRLPAATDALRRGAWGAFRMDAFLGLDVHGATLGLIGYGQIARPRPATGSSGAAPKPVVPSFARPGRYSPRPGTPASASRRSRSAPTSASAPSTTTSSRRPSCSRRPWWTPWRSSARASTSA